MIDLRIHRKIPFLNDYGSALFEKGVLLFRIRNFGESYRSSSAGRRIICREFRLLISVCVSIPSWSMSILAWAYKRMKQAYTPLLKPWPVLQKRSLELCLRAGLGLSIS